MILTVLDLKLQSLMTHSFVDVGGFMISLTVRLAHLIGQPQMVVVLVMNYTLQFMMQLVISLDTTTMLLVDVHPQ